MKPVKKTIFLHIDIIMQAKSNDIMMVLMRIAGYRPVSKQIIVKGAGGSYV